MKLIILNSNAVPETPTPTLSPTRQMLVTSADLLNIRNTVNRLGQLITDLSPSATMAVSVTVCRAGVAVGEINLPGGVAVDKGVLLTALGTLPPLMRGDLLALATHRDAALEAALAARQAQVQAQQDSWANRPGLSA